MVVCLPLTQATRGLIGEAELAAMKPGSYLIDVSRGGIIQQPALITALQEKKLAAPPWMSFLRNRCLPTTLYGSCPTSLSRPI